MTDNPCHTHCVPIRTESGLGCPLVMHHNLNTIYDTALSGKDPETACLKLLSLRRQTWNREMFGLSPIVTKQCLNLGQGWAK